MAKLPISRIVNVTVTRRDRFPTIEGFGVALLLQSKTVAGKLDATHRARTYGSMDEVAADFVSADAFYQAAQLAFAQNPRPLQVKAGWYSAADFAAGADAAAKAGVVTSALDAIQTADDGWYWIDVEASLRDGPAFDAIIPWVQSRRKQAYLTSNDVGHESSTNTTCVSARYKNTVDRTNIFYSDAVAAYPGFAFAAKLGTFNFDEAGAAYTAKFKRVLGLPTLDEGSAVVQAATGFVPALGQNTTAGHMANCQVDVKGVPLVIEGSTLTPNVFTDEIHASDWLAARMEEEVFAALLNAKRVPMDQNGMRTLAGAAEAVMVRARAAGIVADRVDDDGNFLPAYEVIPGDVDDISAAQRKARIAPPVTVNFIYAGAVHYASVNIYQEY